MANFKTHLNVAILVSVPLAGVGWYVGLYGMMVALWCVAFGVLGGLLPDIDLPHSKIAKKGFLVASCILSALSVGMYVNTISAQGAVLIRSIVLWWVGSFCALYFGVFGIFGRLTIHRGMVHSVPYMALCALLLVCTTFYGFDVTAKSSWIFGVFLFIGAMVHLLLDEIYSVNFWGLKLKKSAGTAFKFFERKKWISYVGLYLLLVVVWVISPPIHAFLQDLSLFLKVLW